MVYDEVEMDQIMTNRDTCTQSFGVIISNKLGVIILTIDGSGIISSYFKYFSGFIPERFIFLFFDL